jgi:hypothetical protein
MSYIENPKTKGSGIVCAIPQKGLCPNKCEDCFFQSGRSYLEPLDNNVPNMPPADLAKLKVVRVNDGNDSNIDRDLVMKATLHYPMRFYNTAIPKELDKFDAPVVLTLNPGNMTDTRWHKLVDIPCNLMFVRFRMNMWNSTLADKAIEFYSEHEVPIVLTFMAYFNLTIPDGYGDYYTFRKRTLNSYWAITTEAWRSIMRRYEDNKWVSSCSKIEGEKGTSACRFCGNCLREYFATMERLKEDV